MKLLYYLAAIGKPNLETKIEILLSNLTYLHNKLSINYESINNGEYIGRLLKIPNILSFHSSIFTLISSAICIYIFIH